MSREQSKAAHYIQLLDAARCEGNWDAVPELVRKIRKHAPARTCLTLTAETEHAVTQYSSKARPASRPSTEDSALSSLAQYIPPLLEAIANERQYVEDDFQAQVCLGWIHWYCGEHALAASRLPESIEGEFAQLDGTNKESAEWTKVCALKASYIKGDAQRKIGKVAEGLETFESALPILSSISTSSPQLNKKELMSWSELLLTGFCMLSSYALRTKQTPMLETDTLSAFRSYAKFWESFSVKTGGRVLNAEVSRREVWKEYYVTLSEILQQHLPFPPATLTTAYTNQSNRLQQRAELKRVETNYETLLLSEVDFPKAEEPSEEVEAFVQLAMQNWRVLCGNTWQESDLGEGGAEAVSRGILDLLYRAATKTFHSTAILRHLFTVHLAVAEFDLAFKAFDTYLEIVKRGKARVEKTGEAEYGLDSDELVLETASECIKALCRYGSLQAAEKARDLGHFLEEWLNKHRPHTVPNGNSSSPENGASDTASTFISPTVLAMAWRCIGVGYAQWARLTFDASSRIDMQSRAISCLRKALLPEYKSTSNAETLFSLGKILAERRELSTAIQIVKVGLTPQPTNSISGTGNEAYVNKFSRERSLIPLWHLMALLLSARQEFPSALRSCEGVFDQFEDPKNLFGDSDFNGTYRSEHLSASEKSSDGNYGLVDEMDDFEKENLLEVKITQLSLIEILEGSEVAVNSSDELLSLYARLFGDPLKEMTAATVQAPTLVPPKSSAGTLRSMKGSIFSRSLGKSMWRDLGPTPENSTPPKPETAQTTVNRAPTIHVTQDSGTGDKHHHHHEKLHKKVGLLSHGRGTNRDAMVEQSQQHQNITERHPSIGEVERFSATSHSQESWNEQGSKVLPPDSQQMDQQEPALKSGHNYAASIQDSRLPIGPFPSSTSSITRFSKDSQRRRRTAILVKVWLLIAGFYRRATMYEDAKGAVEEAHKLVTTLEADVSNDPTGLASYESAGWGGKESVAELWGDVFSERGHLAVDQSTPYVALDNYEAALSYFADHPAAIVGLSDILLDIYTEELPPLPNLPPLVLPSTSASNPSASTLHTALPSNQSKEAPLSSSTSGPLGLQSRTTTSRKEPSNPQSKTETALLDRLAARDRAYGLLSALTKLGTGWNYSEAWFALARAYELGGQKDKARDVLWWCVELEEGRAMRGWEVVNAGGYVL